MPAPALSNLIGVTLAGKYELVKRIGEGGMGVVYEAVNALTNRHVAVKLLAAGADDDTARQRLLREARAAAGLRHPNVVDVLDVALDSDYGTFLVMELLHGESLHEYVARRGRLSYTEMVAVLEPVALALELAHAAGVVHRDLKPSNIFLHTDAQGRTTPKLVDFGIAIADGPRFTNTGMMTGTVGYMAPEQMSDAKRATERSDIWAFAVVVYECLSGSLPFQGTTAVELIANVISNRLIPLDQVAPITPAHIVAAVHGALSSEPERRPARISDFASALGFTRAPHDVAPTQPKALEPRAALPPTDPYAATEVRPAPTQREPSEKRERRPKPSRRRLLFGLGGALATGGLLLLTLSRSANSRSWLRTSTSNHEANTAILFDHPAALPTLELRPIEGGTAALGSTLEEARAAREGCVAESGEELCLSATFERETLISNATLRGFRLARHETTNAELFAWLANQPGLFLDRKRPWLADASGPLAAIADPGAPEAGFSLEGQRLVVRGGFGERPAVHISRRAAQRFCAALALRLPTSAEWEWAARGADRRRYPWGNALFGCHRSVSARSAGLSCADGSRGATSVLDWLQDETPQGVTGLAGNAAEWVSDAAPKTWVDPATSCDREGCFIVKGGDWRSPSWLTRAAAGRSAPASLTTNWLGFRCATDLN